MGYFGKAEGPVHVKKENLCYAVDKTEYPGRVNPTPEGIDKFLATFGFSAVLNDNGDIEKLVLKTNYVNPERVWVILNALAYVADEGSYVSFEGENGEHWTWELKDERVYGGPYPDEDEYGEEAEIKAFEDYRYVILKDGTAMLAGYEKSKPDDDFGGLAGLSSLFSVMSKAINDVVMVPDTLDGLPVTAVASKAFFWDRKVYGVALPKTVKMIGDEAFCGCWTLGGFIFPESIRYIGNKAFSSCKAIKKIDIPASACRIGTNVFEQCEALQKVSFEEGINAIPGGMFLSCHSLSEVTIPDSVKCIEKMAFGECTSLSNIILPQGLRRIESGAFLSCTSLESITIPESVTSIGMAAFSIAQGMQLTPNLNIIIKVTAGSYAEQYCKDNSLNYECV